MSVDRYLGSVAEVLTALPREPLERLVDELERAWRRNAQVFLLGNGGSAATAAHLACDLGKGTAAEGRRRLRVIPLVDNVPLITAWANDTSYERVFVEQLANLVRPGDLVIAISGSGSSPNVLAAVRHAASCGAFTVGITGGGGGRLAPLVDLPVIVPDSCMERIEDVHLALGHAVAVALRERFARAPGATPAVFVDRDGVINRLGPDGGYVTRWEHFEFLPGALEALAVLRERGCRVVVVTNQSCIGRGVARHEEVRAINRLMEEAVEAAGGHIEATYLCPHRPEDGCGCRKPKPGLFFLARDDLGIDLARSVVVGDHATDMAAASSIGAAAVLVRTGHGARTEAEGTVRPHVVVNDLREAAEWIVTHQGLCGATTQPHAGGGYAEQGSSLDRPSRP